MFEKSSKVAVNYREKGNEAYAKKSFSNAIVFYNKSLSFAVSKLENALAYANRSAVYFELKKYDECLKNIQWARKNNYPPNKMKTLNEREEKCKMMKEKLCPEDIQKNDPWNYLKLSYHPNPRYPSIIENLIMKSSSIYGRGIYALCDLNPGDIIAIETPVINILFDTDDGRYKHCCNCFKSSMLNLLPCTKTAGVMFCTAECREKCYTYNDSPLNLISTSSVLNVVKGERLMALGRDAFGNDAQFMNYVVDYEVAKEEKTIFDYDFSKPKSKGFKKNLLNCILGLNYRHFNGNSKVDVSRGMKNFMNHLAGIIDLNAMGMQYLDIATIKFTSPSLKLHGSSLLAFGSLLNHSCDPNVQRIAIDGKVVFIVSKAIKKNEQLFINYVADFFNNPNVKDRNEKLKKFGFKCECDACIFNRGNLIQPYASYKSVLSRSLPPKTLESCFNELKENFKFIEEHAFNIHTLANYEFMQRNFILLSYAAFIATFPN